MRDLCDRCERAELSVRTVAIVDQNTGPGWSHRACTTCLPYGHGEFDDARVSQPARKGAP
ncbi:hypothetical protein [Streptomyces alkaliterrae]|uniref:Uncharacterized protein n=1 Tax=Streptomyces alkaliterrae TaxID=2213162 RepID=A0A5P0YVK0_9ACTN|nr:hypothetical protein [Streptomyces alkaliterrae]MQS04311.1 hypothetical protein [Streptomyces alkaliterrae]